MQLVTAIALLALARGASAAGDWPTCPTRAGGASTCTCPAGFTGTYPECTWTATARTGATSTAKDVCAPTIETLVDATIQHIYHMGVKFDSTTPTPQYFFLECQSAKDVYVEHPTIMMQAGSAPKKTYFDQSDMASPVVSSNWYHPLGFAYKYDGAHVVVDDNENPELGMAGISTKDDGVTSYKYLKDGHDLAGSKPDGAWDGTSSYVGGEMDADTSFIGLDSYEPQAFFSQDFWAAHKWGVDLLLEGTSSLSKADDAQTSDGTIHDFFYFCHIHGGMNGRIKVVAGSDDLAARTNAADVTFLNTAGDTRADTAAPTVPYFPATDDEYYFPVSSGGKPATGSLDLQCGTHGIDEYSSSKTSPKCHDTFVCDIGDNVYGKCLDAMDCYMSHHMRTALHAKPEVNFFEQMIPHHINAVNMAKATLKTLTTSGAYADPACCTGDDSLLPVLHNIINVQSQQVQYFEGVLEAARGDGVAKKACAGPDHSVSGSTAAFPASATAASAVAAVGAAAFVSSFSEL